MTFDKWLEQSAWNYDCEQARQAWAFQGQRAERAEAALREAGEREDWWNSEAARFKKKWEDSKQTLTAAHGEIAEQQERINRQNQALNELRKTYMNDPNAQQTLTISLRAQEMLTAEREWERDEAQAECERLREELELATAPTDADREGMYRQRAERAEAALVEADALADALDKYSNEPMSTSMTALLDAVDDYRRAREGESDGR